VKAIQLLLLKVEWCKNAVERWRGGNSNEWVFGRDDLTGSEGAGASHPTSLGGDIITLVPGAYHPSPAHLYIQHLGSPEQSL
jgi:hypothetical protein